MHIIKKIILALTIIASALAVNVALVPVAYAKDKDACELSGYTDPLICGHEKGSEQELMNRIRNILNTIYLWIGIIATIVIIIGGIKYIISVGDAAKVNSAKNTIFYAIIGLIVTLAAFAITNVVIGAINGNV